MEEAKKNFKKCEICKDDATSLCLECISYYCDECYKYIHNKKGYKNHKKGNIEYHVPIDTKCPKLPKNALDLFWTDEICCAYFYFLLKQNKNHKALSIRDGEALKKENIKIDNSTKENESNMEKINI